MKVDSNELVVSGAECAELLTVVIPVYNESASIAGVVDGIVRELTEAPLACRVLILNDGSTDWSDELERRLTIHDRVSLRHFEPNRGKGAVLNQAFPTLDSEIAVVIDADGEYAANDILTVVRPLLENRADWVMGSRYGFGRLRPRQYRLTYLANRGINLWFRLLSGMPTLDLLTGLYAFRTELVSGVILRESRFSYSAELIWKVLHNRAIRLVEVPISYRFRTYAEGKKIQWWETATILLALLRYKFVRRRRG